eukprot:85258-Pelagomonas_calceolata.AAC.1
MLVFTPLLRKSTDRSLRCAIRLWRRLRLTERCLAEGFSRLDVSAEAIRLWYSTQMDGRPSPKLFASSCIIAAAVLIE